MYGEPLHKTPLLSSAAWGIEGCWPLVAEISVSDMTVTWSDFEQPHRPAWDLSGLGPFVFDRQQYEEAILTLTRVPVPPARDPSFKSEEEVYGWYARAARNTLRPPATAEETEELMRILEEWDREDRP